MGLTRIALTRPIFIFMLMLAAAFLGIMSLRSMRVEQNPEVNFGVLTISTVYPGAGPEEINTLISRKVEEAIAGVTGIREVTSSSQEGISVVVANFEIGVNMDTALNETRAKVDAIVGQLPREIEKPTVQKLDTASSPVLFLAIKSQRMDNQELRDLADDRLADRFARIPGVASASVSGGDVRELQVRLKKDKLVSYGIGITSVQQAVQAATLNVPSGRFVSGEEEYSVRVLGEFLKPEDLENLIITVSNPTNPMGRGASVRLKDIATVEDTVAERRSYSRLNGADAVILTLQKTREGNAVEISKSADPIIKSIESDYGLEVIKTFDQAVTISESLADLWFALGFGIFLVALIVYLFLHNLRGTIIVSIAIPVCILATFIALKLFGFTINNLSMLALSLAVGVLVDDAIVVLENIYRHLRMGEHPRDAAINGRSEIGLAAIAITLADVVVFLPIGTMGGILGQFFKPLGIGFAITVLLSLFVSFTVTPLLASRWYRAGEDLEHPTGRFARAFERGFAKFENLYRRQLRWALEHRWFVFSVGNLSLVAVFVLLYGSFQPDLKAALNAGFGLTKASFAIGLILFAFNYWPKVMPTVWRWVYFLLASLVLAAVLPWVSGGDAPPAAAPVVVLVLAGVVGLIANIGKKVARSRIVLSAVAFGLVFPVAAAIGYGWASWKEEPIFKFAFFPESDGGQVSVNIELPPGSSLEATRKVVERIEAIVIEHPDTKYVVSQVGSAGGGGFSAGSVGTNTASVTITLNDKKALMDSIAFWKKHSETLRTKKDSAVAGEILERVGRVPGAEVTVSANSGVGFGSPIQMSFAGEDREQLLATTQNIVLKLRNGAIGGVINADVSSKPGKPELRAIPDRAKLADTGLSVQQVAGAMRTLYEGDNTTKFRTEGKEYDIRVMMDPEDRNDPNTINTVPVSFSQGTPIYLSQVADIVRGVGVDKIDRRDRSEELRISADLLDGYAAGTVQAQIDDWMAKEKLVPEGVKIKPLGQADVQARESGYLFSAMGIGLVLVFMLLASLYDNLLYPLIIQMAQPQAMVGALLALMITDKQLNIVGFIGIITLVGLVGKNAILVVDYTNTLRARGQGRAEALMEAGPTRLRPIMMTTLALILGILPVALAIGRGSEFRETIGITIIGGISLSTLLTLMVIPCSYTIFDDLSNYISRLRGVKPSSPRDMDRPEDLTPEPEPVAP